VRVLSTLNLCLLFPREVAKPQALPHHLLNSMNIVMAMLIVFVAYSNCLSTTYQKIKNKKIALILTIYFLCCAL
jgi:Ca2+/Na+ antiporter